MKLAWFSPFPVDTLVPHGLQLARAYPSHPCSWIVALSDELVRRPDVQLDIFTFTHTVRRDQTIALPGGLRVHVLRWAVPGTLRGFPVWFPWSELTGYRSQIRRLRQACRKLQPDLVHGHGTEGPYGLAAIRSGFPHAVSIQGIVSDLQFLVRTFRFQVMAKLECRAIREGADFLCRTAYDQGYVRKVNPAARIHYFPEAMRPVFFEAPAWEDVRPPRILFVGSGAPHKGLRLLVDAVRGLPDTAERPSLEIVGSVPAALQEEMAALLGRERIRFRGVLTAPDIVDAQRRAMVFVHPSLGDNSPNSVVEAMVAGMPIIASSVGGLTSLLENNVTGLVVPPGDVPALSAALARLLSDAGLRLRLGRAAREAAGKHRPDRVADVALDVYRTILAQTTSR